MNITFSDTLVQKCRRTSCRGCAATGLQPVLDLEMMPPSDRLLTTPDIGDTERKFPLELAFCPNCTLLQILETVPPAFLFSEDYLYFSSFSQAWLDHSRANALELIERQQLKADSLVVELASNDGYLLRNFVDRNIPVLGIDPAPRQAEAARQIGVPTINAFFGAELAQQLISGGQGADVIIANNVLAHVADTHGFIDGITLLLKETGVAVIEVPYVRDMIDHHEFDTIYHEHLCYFSLTSLALLFQRHGLYVNDVRRLPTHGGSLRVFVEKEPAPTPALENLLDEEARCGLNTYAYSSQFSGDVERIRNNLKGLINGLAAAGKRIAAYGAAAKGTILLNSLGLDQGTIRYVVDRNVHKHGKYLPGVHIRIEPVERLIDDRPDYVLILPWNFADEIVSQQSEYLRKGGILIIPIPGIRLISHHDKPKPDKRPTSLHEMEIGRPDRVPTAA